MVDPRIAQLVEEIGDLYRQTCALAERYNGAIAAESQESIKAFKPRPNSRFPELDRFNDVFDQQEVLNQAWKSPPIRAMQQRCAIFAWCVTAYLNFELLASSASTLVLILANAVTFSLMFGIYHGVPLYGSRLRKFLRETLRSRGVPICADCGYDLRGQSSQRCPECGGFMKPMIAASASPTLTQTEGAHA